jgi:hypothetical protein
MGDNSRILETYEQLKDWLFYEMKMPPNINEQAFRMWDQALKSPTLTNIRMFWVFAGMNRHFPEVLWDTIKTELDNSGPDNII